MSLEFGAPDDEPELSAATDTISYRFERDGDLRTYIERCHNERFNPLFRGPKHFKEMWDAKYMEPYITTVRLMWNVSRGDESFTVTPDGKLEGNDDVAVHTARSGVYEPEEILLEAGPRWEIHSLRPMRNST